MAGYLDLFPQSEFYPNQKEAMESIHQGINENKVILFEGACGTGKTFSALIPALYHARESGKKVVIATPVHEQMEQFMVESRVIPMSVKTVVFIGKSHLCPLDKSYEECDVLRGNARKILTIEKKLKRLKTDSQEAFEERDMLMSDLSILRGNYCFLAYDTFRARSELFSSWLFASVRHPQEVVEYAEENGYCGYELLKACMSEAQLLICNYHHILDMDILPSTLNWLDAELEDLILILDESHNLESAARSHASANLAERTVDRGDKELSRFQVELELKDEQIGRFTIVLGAIKGAIAACSSGARSGSDWSDVKVREIGGHSNKVEEHILGATGMTRADVLQVLKKLEAVGTKLDIRLMEMYKARKAETVRISALTVISRFMIDFLNLANSKGYHPFINIRKWRHGVLRRLELLSCIPKEVTGPILANVHSAILMSATLRPFDVLKKTLGITRPTLELTYPMAFPIERRLTLALPLTPLFARNRGNEEVTYMVAHMLSELIEVSDGNVLIIFPSFFEAQKYYNLLDFDDKYLDRIGESSKDIKEDFFSMGQSGKKSVLFSYLWGSLTEGVDYSEGRARMVIVVGVGYPSLSHRMRVIEHAYNEEYGAGTGWSFAIELPTVRKIRQTVGRIVRSPEDYGVRVLADVRYSELSIDRLGKYSLYKIFPEDERNEFMTVPLEDTTTVISDFFQSLKRVV